MSLRAKDNSLPSKDCLLGAVHGAGGQSRLWSLLGSPGNVSSRIAWLLQEICRKATTEKIIASQSFIHNTQLGPPLIRVDSDRTSELASEATASSEDDLPLA